MATISSYWPFGPRNSASPILRRARELIASAVRPNPSAIEYLMCAVSTARFDGVVPPTSAA